jgi:hypothetical protein
VSSDILLGAGRVLPAQGSKHLKKAWFTQGTIPWYRAFGGQGSAPTSPCLHSPGSHLSLKPLPSYRCFLTEADESLGYSPKLRQQ